ncbi:MAG: LCP family protein [Anaerolineae bacterium]|nr:LCP family protein [Anaerolineae bacterium]
MIVLPDASSQPIETPPEVLPPRPRRRARSGCTCLILALALLVMIPVSLAGLAAVLYLLFPPAPLDVVILGVDARPGEGYAARTDTVLLLNADPADLGISLFSIPRDLYLVVPGYGAQRINTINALGEQDTPGGGPALVQAALAENFPVQPDRYVRLDFAAFVTLVDALGGITIDVPGEIVDTQYPTADGGTMTVRFEAGVQRLDGTQALAYARTRHADDDYRRIERQQQVILGVLNELVQPENWPRLPELMQDFFAAVDTDLTPTDLLILAPPVWFGLARDDVAQLTIDRDLIGRSPDGYAVPDYAAINPWLEDNFD